jgi:hypothetical protein
LGGAERGELMRGGASALQVARKYSRQLRFVVVDISAAHCPTTRQRGGQQASRACQAELQAMRKEWGSSSFLLREADQVWAVKPHSVCVLQTRSQLHTCVGRWGLGHPLSFR